MNRKFSNKSKSVTGQTKNQFLMVSEKSLLLEFLLLKMPHKSRNNIKSLLKNKQVLVDGEVISQFDHPLSEGQKIEFRHERIPKEKDFFDFTIKHEDHDIIVIEKRAGLLSVATDKKKSNTVYSMLSKHVKQQNPLNKIFIVHRLDRETSGLMIFAKSEKVKHQLQESWNDTIIERTYIAAVEGEVKEPSGTITSFLYEGDLFKMYSSPSPEKGKKAVTHFSVIKKNKDFSLLKVNLETGRKNQIRVHMKDIGHPVVGDKKYGAVTHPIKRLGLHAQSLSFIHPSSKKNMKFESNIPRAFQRLF